MNANIKTIGDLKEYLQGIIENLSWDYEDTDEVCVSCNTYGMGQNFIAVRNGFIDFDRPTPEDYEF